MYRAMAARINHIALIARQPDHLADFYASLLQTMVIHRKVKDGKVYSLWLALEPEGVLMIERCNTDTAPLATPGEIATYNSDPEIFHTRQPGLHLLAFSMAQNDLQGAANLLDSLKISIVDQTEFSLYFYDPEGNRVALSAFDAPEYLQSMETNIAQQ